jgi:hypothetical protein
MCHISSGIERTANHHCRRWTARAMSSAACRCFDGMSDGGCIGNRRAPLGLKHGTVKTFAAGVAPTRHVTMSRSILRLSETWRRRYRVKLEP